MDSSKYIAYLVSTINCLQTFSVGATAGSMYVGLLTVRIEIMLDNYAMLQLCAYLLGLRELCFGTGRPYLIIMLSYFARLSFPVGLLPCCCRFIITS